MGDRRAAATAIACAALAGSAGAGVRGNRFLPCQCWRSWDLMVGTI
ncbi:hypothetical protein [Kitasatospora sp. NPDC093102]